MSEVESIAELRPTRWRFAFPILIGVVGTCFGLRFVLQWLDGEVGGWLVGAFLSSTAWLTILFTHAIRVDVPGPLTLRATSTYVEIRGKRYAFSRIARMMSGRRKGRATLMLQLDDESGGEELYADMTPYRAREARAFRDYLSEAYSAHRAGAAAKSSPTPEVSNRAGDS